MQQAVPDTPRSSQQQDGSPGGASPASAARPGQTADQAHPELPDEVSKDELDRYTPGARSRIVRLLEQRRALEADNVRLKALEPSAQAADSVSRYLRDNDIGKEDFLLSLDAMASLRRGDFQRAHAILGPYWKMTEEYLGYSLPPDLQEQVRQGHMTTQAAQAFSRERMDRAMFQNNLQRQRQAFGEYAQQTQQQQTKAAREYLAKQVSDTVNAWEAQVAQSDPEYVSKKQAAVQSMMWAVVREKGKPRTQEQALWIAQESLRRVNHQYTSWLPPRRPTSRIPSSTGRTAGVTPEPRSLAEAIAQARQTAPRL